MLVDIPCLNTFKHFRLPPTRLSKNFENDLTQKKKVGPIRPNCYIDVFRMAGAVRWWRFWQVTTSVGSLLGKFKHPFVNPATSWESKGPTPMYYIRPAYFPAGVALRGSGGLLRFP